MSIEKNQTLKINGQKMTAIYLPGESDLERSRRLSQKLIERHQLVGLGNFLRERNLVIGFTTGAFDIPHYGHSRYLQIIKSISDVLVVGVNSDKSIKGYKNPDRPIVGQDDRTELLSSFEDVNYLTIFDELDGAEVIRLLKPDNYLCVIGSWQGELGSKTEVMAMAEIGGQVYFCPPQGPKISTTAIIERIEKSHGERIIPTLKAELEMKANDGL